MKKIQVPILSITILLTVFWMLFMAFLMIKSCENYQAPEKNNIIQGLTKKQSYELFEDAYNAGYQKGRHYARIKKITPFEIDVEADSALIMNKYWINDSTPK